MIDFSDYPHLEKNYRKCFRSVTLASQYQHTNYSLSVVRRVSSLLGHVWDILGRAWGVLGVSEAWLKRF